jgi:hypothetical protein
MALNLPTRSVIVADFSFKSKKLGNLYVRSAFLYAFSEKGGSSMLSPTQQSYALIAAHTALFAAGGCLCGYLTPRFVKSASDSKDKQKLTIACMLTAGACLAIAKYALPSHDQIWRSACLCDSVAPGAKKYLIEYVDKFHRSLGSRAVYALSKELFHKYVDNEKFYRSFSAGFGLVAYLVPSVCTWVFFNSK